MRERRRTDAEIMGAAEAREECKRREVGGTEKKKRRQGRCLKTQRNSEKEKKVKRKKHKRERRTEGWTGGSEVETRRGRRRGEKREREEEAPSVSLRAPAGGSSSCLPSQRRFLLHFK